MSPCIELLVSGFICSFFYAGECFQISSFCLNRQGSFFLLVRWFHQSWSCNTAQQEGHSLAVTKSPQTEPEASHLSTSELLTFPANPRRFPLKTRPGSWVPPKFPLTSFFLSSFGPAPPPPPLIAFHTDRSPPSPAFPNTART
nr:related to extensin precursor [imported] - Neurospora crassa [Neurospora crassa]